MRRIVLILVFLLTIGSLYSQKLEIGVFTEPQFAWITSDEGSVVSDGAIVNLNTGIEFDFFFMPNYAFTLGLNLNNQGGKLNYPDSIEFEGLVSPIINPGGFTMKHNLQYMGIPLGLKLKTEEMGYSTFYVHGGICPLINLKAVTSSEQLSITSENIKSDINIFSMNYFVEAGIEYRLAGNTAIIVGFKWSSGFNDVTSNDIANNNLKSAGLHLGLLF